MGRPSSPLATAGLPGAPRRCGRCRRVLDQRWGQTRQQRVGALPGVESVSGHRTGGGADSAAARPAGPAPGVAAVTALTAFGLIIPDHAQFQQIGAPIDAAFGTTVDRDRIVAGRPPDPSVVDEMTLGEGLAAELGLHVGDRLAVESFTPAQIAAVLAGAGDVGEPAGPRVDLRVVAIVRRPLDLGDRGASGGLLVLTPAFGRAYADRIGVFGTRIRIRTDHGVADVPQVLAASRAVLGNSLFIAQSLAVGTQGARAAIDLFASALWICAAVAAVAGVIAVAIVTARELQLMREEHERLRELGCTRWQLVMIGMVPTVLAAVIGGVFAVAAAIALSPLFPLGVARRADPDVGLHADWTVLAVGAVVLVGLVVAIGLAAAYRSTSGRSLDRAAAGPTRPSTLAERVAATGMAPTMTERGPDGGRVGPTGGSDPAGVGRGGGRDARAHGGAPGRGRHPSPRRDAPPVRRELGLQRDGRHRQHTMRRE